MTDLVEHARMELTALGYDEDAMSGLINVVQAFAEMGHSGMSAMIAIPIITDLLCYKNLSPLTNDPDEWIHHTEEMWGEPGGVWQNIRNGEAFSSDGGRSYTLNCDAKDASGKKPIYISAEKNPTDG
jgi:hypothetical protein